MSSSGAATARTRAPPTRSVSDFSDTMFFPCCEKQLLTLASSLWFQDGKQEKDRHRGRGRHWRPALQSISEAASQSSSSSVSEAATS